MRKMMFLLLLSPLTAHAQPSCTAADTVSKCFFSTLDQRLAELRPQATMSPAELQSAPTSAFSQAADQSVQHQMQSRTPGPMAPGSAIGSANDDFLSRFIATLQSAQLDQKNRQLNFAYNVPEKILDSSVKFQAVFYQPEIAKNIQDMLTSAGKTADLSALQSKLNDADDVSVMVSASRQTMHVGRSFKAHRKEFEDLYQHAVLQPINSDRTKNARLRDKAQMVLQRYSSQFPAGHAVDIESVKIGEVTLLEPGFVSDLQTSARSEAELEAERDRLLEDNHLSSFADLLANQPQLSFSFGGRWRDRAVGPNELDAHASYEMGFVNLNGACPTGKCDPVGFKNYVEKHLRSLQAESSDKTGSKDNRLSLAIDYSRTRDYAFSLPADNLDLQMPRATHWTYALTYARQMVFDKQGKPIGRIDVTGRYENFSDDPLHQDRGTLDLTYTQKVSDTFSLPIGISYANHGEFLGQVDRTLSAHFGLHAKVFGQDP
jgi:hypothetical protein